MLQIQHDHILSCYQIHQVKNKIGFTLSNSEKAMAPHFSTLAWKIHGQRSLVGCSPWGRQESDTTERLHFHSSLSCIGERNGNPLQCSCLQNPRDGEAWQAAVYGVAQSWTRLKRLSSSSSHSEVSHIKGKKKDMPPKYFLNRNIEKIEQPCSHFLVIINILSYNGTFVTTNETTLIKYY